MANVPGKPTRRAAKVGNDSFANARPGTNNTRPGRRAATNVGKGAYNRRSAGVSAAGQPVGDHDAGNNAYRKNNPKSSTASPPYSRAGQPFNGKSVSRGSRRMKGVD